MSLALLEENLRVAAERIDTAELDPGSRPSDRRARPGSSAAGSSSATATAALPTARCRRRVPRAGHAGHALGLRLVGLWRRGVANGIDVRRHTLAIDLPRLPAAFDGYRILHIADPHFDAAPGLGEAILRSVAGAEVDLCVLTGDYRAAVRGPFTETAILPTLAALRAAVRAADGFLATLGNHDPGDIAPHLERLGFEMLLNRTRRIRRGAEQITVTGVDDVHRYYTPAAAAALAAHDPARFGIALVHSPEFAGEAAAAGYDLYLCGHTHGGQVCLPGGRR